MPVIQSNVTPDQFTLKLNEIDRLTTNMLLFNKNENNFDLKTEQAIMKIRALLLEDLQKDILTFYKDDIDGLLELKPVITKQTGEINDK